ncbi:MAG: DNA internalization-related competence protein ComEC/Rec2 [Chromatiales bacterium]|jgi:competence protein ComEC
MWSKTLFFVAGVLLFQHLPALPAVYWLLLVPLSAWLGRGTTYGIYLTVLLSGFCWSLVMAQFALAQRLPAELVSQEIRIEGKIADIPKLQGQGWRFNFRIARALQDSTEVSMPQLVRLGWYRNAEILKAGQGWTLHVRFKPPTGHHNPGRFNYETWLFQQGIHAKGYVLEHDDNQKTTDAVWYSDINSLRQQLSDRLAEFSDHAVAAALSRALLVGDKSAISPEYWQAFRATGTNHLIAISGLHIGFIAGLVYAVSGFFWSRSAHLCLLLPAPRWQAASALLAATAYAALAGFAVPTQRALIMLTVVLGAVLLKQPIQPNRHLPLALVLVLLLDPLAVLAAGFWLSFVAVAAIALVLSGRLRMSVWLAAGKTQIGISLLLLPILIFWFGQFSLLAPLINLLLVPVFAFWVVPATLLLGMLVQIDCVWCAWLMNLHLAAMQWLLELLSELAQQPSISLDTGNLPALNLLLLLAAVLLLILPAGLPGRWPGLLLGSLVFLPQHNHPHNALSMVVLDVGQGLSVLLQTGRRVLLYDLGPAYGSGYDATRSLVVPALKARGITAIDTLIISHADSDHAGHVGSLLDEFQVSEVLSGERLEPGLPARPCVAGLQWRWNITEFEMLSPREGHSHQGNNASCVLRIRHGDTHILLTGDIEKSIEQQLVSKIPDKLKSQIVVVPHHGSLTSSSPEFVRAVGADYVLNSSGYLNRYDFPRAEVVQTWLQDNAVFYDTALHGAVELSLDAQGKVERIYRYRTDALHYWYWPRSGL